MEDMTMKHLLLAATAALFAFPAFAENGCDGYCREGDGIDGSRRGGHDRHYDRGDRHDRYDRRDSWNRHRHYNHRPRTVVSFNYGTPYYGPGHYYRPAVVYAPPPAVLQPNVVYINDTNSREVANDDGRYCREYQSKIKVAGQTQETYGTACMQPDGTWQIIS